MPIQVLICEDELLTLQQNQRFLQDYSGKYKLNIKCIAFQKCDQKFRDAIRGIKFDLAFLDIDLVTVSGIDVAKRLQKFNPKILFIFITKHKEYSIDVFDLLAYGFLTKPVNEKRLERLFRRAVVQIAAYKRETSKYTITFTCNREQITLRQMKISYIIKEGQASNVVAAEKSYLVYEPIVSIEQRLEPIFTKLDAGILVNMQYIKEITGNEVTMNNGQKFMITRSRKKIVIQQYKDFANGL